MRFYLGKITAVPKGLCDVSRSFVRYSFDVISITLKVAVGYR